MLIPVVASLAVVVPAALAVSELVLLRQSMHRSRRFRRALRRRVLLLFIVSALASAVVIDLWRG